MLAEIIRCIFHVVIMVTTRRLWWVLCGLLSWLLNFASGDWMLHTPGGGPLNERCPCLPRELCPRLFGVSPQDFWYFGQIPVCMDDRQMRCCGASMTIVLNQGTNMNQLKKEMADDVTKRKSGEQNINREAKTLNFVELSNSQGYEDTKPVSVKQETLSTPQSQEVTFTNEYGKLVPVIGGTSKNRNGVEDTEKLGNVFQDESTSQHVEGLTLTLTGDEAMGVALENDAAVDVSKETVNETVFISNGENVTRVSGDSVNARSEQMYLETLSSLQNSVENALAQFKELQKTLLNFLQSNSNEKLQSSSEENFDKTRAELESSLPHGLINNSEKMLFGNGSVQYENNTTSTLRNDDDKNVPNQQVSLVNSFSQEEGKENTFQELESLQGVRGSHENVQNETINKTKDNRQGSVTFLENKSDEGDNDNHEKNTVSDHDDVVGMVEQHNKADITGKDKYSSDTTDGKIQKLIIINEETDEESRIPYKDDDDDDDNDDDNDDDEESDDEEDEEEEELNVSTNVTNEVIDTATLAQNESENKHMSVDEIMTLNSTSGEAKLGILVETEGRHFRTFDDFDEKLDIESESGNTDTIDPNVKGEPVGIHSGSGGLQGGSMTEGSRDIVEDKFNNTHSNKFEGLGNETSLLVGKINKTFVVEKEKLPGTMYVYPSELIIETGKRERFLPFIVYPSNSNVNDLIQNKTTERNNILEINNTESANLTEPTSTVMKGTENRSHVVLHQEQNNSISTVEQPSNYNPVVIKKFQARSRKQNTNINEADVTYTNKTVTVVRRKRIKTTPNKISIITNLTKELESIRSQKVLGANIMVGEILNLEQGRASNITGETSTIGLTSNSTHFRKLSDILDDAESENVEHISLLTPQKSNINISSTSSMIQNQNFSQFKNLPDIFEDSASENIEQIALLTRQQASKPKFWRQGSHTVSKTNRVFENGSQSQSKLEPNLSFPSSSSLHMHQTLPLSMFRSQQRVTTIPIVTESPIDTTIIEESEFEDGADAFSNEGVGGEVNTSDGTPHNQPDNHQPHSGFTLKSINNQPGPLISRVHKISPEESSEPELVVEDAESTISQTTQEEPRTQSINSREKNKSESYVNADENISQQTVTGSIETQNLSQDISPLRKLLNRNKPLRIFPRLLATSSSKQSQLGGALKNSNQDDQRDSNTEPPVKGQFLSEHFPAMNVSVLPNESGSQSMLVDQSDDNFPDTYLSGTVKEPMDVSSPDQVIKSHFRGHVKYQPPCKSSHNSKRTVRCSTPAIKLLIRELSSLEQNMNKSLSATPDADKIDISEYLPIRSGNQSRLESGDGGKELNVEDAAEGSLELVTTAGKPVEKPEDDRGVKIIFPDMNEEDNVMKIILPDVSKSKDNVRVPHSAGLFKSPDRIENGFVPSLPVVKRSGTVSIIGPIPRGFVDPATIPSSEKTQHVFSLPLNLKRAPFREQAPKEVHERDNSEKSFERILFKMPLRFKQVYDQEKTDIEHNVFIQQQFAYVNQQLQRRNKQQ